MEAFTVSASCFLASPVTLLLFCITLTEGAFLFLQKLVAQTKFRMALPGLLFGVCNGLVAVAMEMASNRAYPLCVILFSSIIVVLEFTLVTKDTRFTYFYLFMAFLMNFSCLYNLSVALPALLPDTLWPLGGREYRIMILSMTGLLSSLALFYMGCSKRFPSRELRFLIHSKTQGMLLLLYLIACNVTVSVTTAISLPLVWYDHVSRNLEVAFHLDLLLKSGLILGCSYLIVMVNCWQQKNLQKSRELDASLQKERGFRDSAQRNAMLSYCANVTKGNMEEGSEYFSKELWAGSSNYFHMLRNFAQLCVYPEDWNKLFSVSTPAYFQDKLENEPSYFLRFRLSPAKMLELTNLPDSVKAKLQDVKKEWIWVEIHCTVTVDQATDDILVYVALTDVDSQVDMENSLRQAAIMDPLTNIYNRAALEDRIREYLMSVNPSGALILIDLDHFKDVNDNLGHPAGDRLLRETASMIRSVFRSGDIIGRLGGDEFCIFAIGLSDREILERRIVELNERGWRVHATKSGHQFQSSLSIGAALCPQCGKDYHTLYRRADIALYEAKNAGRNTFRFYSPDMRDPSKEGESGA